jgi:hypothetical protein
VTAGNSAGGEGERGSRGVWSAEVVQASRRWTASPTKGVSVRQLGRRDFIVGSSGLVLGAAGAFVGSRYWLLNYTEPGRQFVWQRKRESLERRLLPAEGKSVPVALHGSVEKLVEHGVIDLEKWQALYAGRRVTLPEWIGGAFSSRSEDSIQIDAASAPLLLNILWALGISNRTAFNERSPLQGPSLHGFASTGGWTLGKESNGGAYFNRVPIVALDEEQEALVLKLAERVYRPCCNNSTFFQDCNHGSAMLGLLELGASQGRREDELYDIGLIFNTYWFPETYVNVGLYVEAIEGTRLEDVPPERLLSREFSSGQGFRTTVLEQLARKSLLPGATSRGSGGCSA